MSSPRRALLFALFFAVAVAMGAPRLLPGEEIPASALLRSVSRLLEEEYYDPSRIRPRAMLLKALQSLEDSVDAFEAEGGEEGPLSVRMGKDRLQIAAEVQNLDDFARAFGDAFEFLKDRYSGTLALDEVFYRGLNRALASLDPHTTFFPPKAYQDFTSDMEGEFFGIGAVIGIRKGRLTIIEPLPNSPAVQAGIKKSDYILGIGEVSTVNMATEEAVRRIRGKEGTKVRLAVGRGESEVLDLTIQRGRIVIPSIVSKELGDGLGYVRLTGFQEKTTRQLKEALEGLSPERPLRGLLLDLRKNSGGLLDQAVTVADLFLKAGLIVATEGPDGGRGEREERFADKEGDQAPYPIVVLVNEQSASASEILAGALKLHGRALIVGERTFGKGSVQSLRDQRHGIPGGGALKLTVSQYLLRGRASIQTVGVAPDVELARVLVTPKEINLFDAGRWRRREEDLDSHLESAAARAEPPLHTIRYFHPVKEPKEGEAPEEEEEEEDTSVYSGQVDLAKDLSAGLALDLLKAAAAAAEKGEAPFERAGFVKDEEAAIGAVAAREMDKIAESLKAQGVDFAAGPEGEGPFELRVEGLSPDRTFSAKGGAPFTLKVKVKNLGKEAAHRLFARVKGTPGEFGFLDGREVVFGKVGPGEEREATLTAETDAGALTRTDEARLVLCRPDREGLAETRFFFRVDGRPRPAFAVSFDLKDNGERGSKGNGNGWPEPEEKVSLLMRFKNIGAGEARLVIAALLLPDKGSDSIYLERGREEFKTVGPGEEKEVEFAFRVLRPPEGELRVEPIVQDGPFGVSTSRILAFAFPPPPGPPPLSAAHDPPPSVTLRLADGRDPSGLLTRDARLKLSGRAEDNGKVARLLISVNEDKVHVAGPAEGGTLAFENVEAVLKPGALNVIRVTAEDDAGQRETTWYMVRHLKEAPAPVAQPDLK